MELVEYAETVIIPFIKKYVKKAHSKGLVIGISGGIDSALVSLLAQKAIGKENILHVLIPIDSNPNDLKDGLEFCEKFNLNYVVDDLSNVYHTFLSVNKHLNNLAKMNTKVRLRMVDLYAHGQSNNYLVCGTDNMCERYTGYFTKFGDGAADLLPISSLLKREVFELARFYGCTEAILNRKPSAGLIDNQTDELEMGISYEDLDNFLINKKDGISENSLKRIAYLHKVSQHKRSKIPEPRKFVRNENK